MALRVALLVSLALPAAAFAGTFDDRGTDLVHDPYVANSSLTTGRIQRFRTLYGEPDALVKALSPAVPAPAPTAPVAPPVAPPEKGMKRPEGTAATPTTLAPEPPQKPDVAPPPKAAHADLPVPNPTSAWAVVTISGVKIGLIDPYDTGLIENVPAGAYDITFSGPTGYTWTDRVETVSR